MKLRTRLMLAFLVCGGISLSAQNWPQFRGANASGIAEGKPTPTTWNAEKNENLAWKVEIPGLAHSSPIVWQDKVFVTTAVSSDPKSVFRSGLYGDVDSAEDVSKHSWKVYCLDKKTGKILWQQTAYEGTPKTKRHIKSTFANSTPTTNGKYVVAYFGSEGLYCYDLKGKLKWKVDLGVLNAGWFFDPGFEWGTASSPIIYKDLVIVQCDIQKGSFIAAYNLKDGKQVWKTAREEIPSWGTPTIVESKARVELVTNATKAARGYDPLTGKELWMLKGNPEITSTTPIAAHDLIYICNSYNKRFLAAIKQGAANGDISLKAGETTNTSIAWSLTNSGSYQPSPLIYGDQMYVCNNNGALSVHNAKTGERLYQERVGRDGGSFSASPVAADGKIYFSSEDGDVFVLKAGAKHELLAKNPMGEVMMATPAISDGMLFIRGQKHLFAIAEKAAPKEAAVK